MTNATTAREAVTSVHGYCAQCKSRCGTIATVSSDGRLIGVRPDPNHPNHGFCVKGAAAPELVHNEGRIKFPLRRTTPKGDSDPGWQRITWDEALDETVAQLRAIAAEHGPEAVVFTRPAPGGNHSGEWSQFLERLAAAFGSPNVMTTSHICSWGRGNGLGYTFGKGLPSAHYEASRTILIWGHNPAISSIQNWLRILDAQKRGARLIVVDPRATGTTAKADRWIRVRPGTDAALALGVINLMISSGWIDREFVARWTNGPFLVDQHTGEFVRSGALGIEGDPQRFVVWDAATRRPAAIDSELDPATWGVVPDLSVEASLAGSAGRVQVRSAFSLLAERAAQFDPARVAGITEVPEAELRALAEEIGTGGPVSYDTYNGVEQHIDTAQTSRALGVMYALTGWLDAEGGNVSLGEGRAAGRAGKGPLDPEQARKRLGFSERPLGAPKQSVQAYNFYEAAINAKPYPVRALVAFGGNALLQNGDTLKGKRAMESLDFHLHVDMFHNPTGDFADIVLPAATAWESPGLAASFAGGPATQAYAQYRAPVVGPQWESRPDVEILFDLAVRLGLGEHFWNGSVDAAWDASLRRMGTTLADLKAHPEGMTLGGREVGHRDYARVEDGRVIGFATPSRKVELYSEQFGAHGYDPLPDAVDRAALFGAEYPLILTSSKLVQYTHSSGRGIPALRKQVPAPYLEIHAETARALGIADGKRVRLSTRTGSIVLAARISDLVTPGVVSTQTGWWEACEELGLPAYDPFSNDGANVNMIMTNDVLDPISGSVPVKDYPCKVEAL